MSELKKSLKCSLRLCYVVTGSDSTQYPIQFYDLGSCFRIFPFMLMSCTGSSEAVTMRSVLAASLMSPDPTSVGKLLHIENLGG